MLLVTGKEILQEINLKLDETIYELNKNMCELLQEKDKALGSLETKNKNQKEEMEKLTATIKKQEEQYKKYITKTGGLTKQNNKLQKDKLILQERIKSLNLKIKNQEKTLNSLANNEIEKQKLQAIIIQQEKIIDKKLKRKTTKEEIINYDKKNPLMK